MMLHTQFIAIIISVLISQWFLLRAKTESLYAFMALIVASAAFSLKTGVCSGIFVNMPILRLNEGVRRKFVNRG